MGKDNFDQNLPDWLLDPNNADGDDGAEDFDDALSWMQSDEKGQKPDSQRLGVTGELPWLQDQGQTVKDEQASIGGTGELPWLQTEDKASNQRDSSRLGVTGELPWLNEAPQQSSRATQELEQQLDWLAGQHEDEKDEFAPPSEAIPLDTEVDDSAAMPDWLDDIDSLLIDEEDEDELLGMLEDEALSAQSTPMIASAAQEEAFPSWLDNFEDVEEEVAPIESIFKEAPEEALPDWLGSFSDDEPRAMPQPTPAPMSSDAPLPDWLNNLDILDDEKPAEPQPTSPAMAAPTWLAEVETFAREEVTPEPQQFQDEALPDWMLGESFATVESVEIVEEVVEEEVLPDWVFTPEAAPDEAIELDEVLEDDWLENESLEALFADESISSTVDSPVSIRKIERKAELTYEEWEQQQAEAAMAQERQFEKSLLDDLPDEFFTDNEAIPPAPTLAAEAPILDELPSTPEITQPPTGPLGNANYVPDWFLGVEEQKLDDAPDWVKTATSGVTSSDSFMDLDISSLAPPPPTPEPVAPQASLSDIPDWFQGFDTSGESEAAEPSFDFMGDSGPDLEGLAAFDAESPDWLQDFMPEAPATITPLANLSETPATPESEAVDAMDWLGDIEGMDFSTEEEAEAFDFDFDAAFSTPATSVSKESSLFSDLELRDMSRKTDLDSFLDFDNQRGLAVRKPSTSDLMTTFDESSGDLSTSLFEGLDDDIIQAISHADQPQTADSLFNLGESSAVDSGPFEIFQAPTSAASWIEDIRPETTISLSVGNIQIDVDQQRLVDLPDELRKLREFSQTVSTQAHAPSSGPSAVFQQNFLGEVTGGLDLSPFMEEAGTPILQNQLRITEPQAQSANLLATLVIASQPDVAAGTLDLEADAETATQTETRRQRRAKARAVRIKTRAPRQWDRVLISLLLLSVMLGAFLTDALHVADNPSGASLAKEQPVFINTMDSLNEGDYVLVAFEYGPTGAGELNPLAEALLRDILHQGAIPIIISTNPLGTLNARAVMNTLAEDETLRAALPRNQNRPTTVEVTNPRGELCARYLTQQASTTRSFSQVFNNIYQNAAADPTTAAIENTLCDNVIRAFVPQDRWQRIFVTIYDAFPTVLPQQGPPKKLESHQDYYLLRYISGGAIGIRALTSSEDFARLTFGQDSTGKGTGFDFGTLDSRDFRLVLIFAETGNDLRLWAEQFDVEGLTKFAAVTTAAEPFASAYTDKDGAYQGYMAGIRDTMRYNALRNQETRAAFKAPDNADVPDPDVSQWHSFTLGTLVATFIIGLGFLFNLGRILRRTPR